jgi:hypothetical protein
VTFLPSSSEGQRGLKKKKKKKKGEGNPQEMRRRSGKIITNLVEVTKKKKWKKRGC